MDQTEKRELTVDELVHALAETRRLHQEIQDKAQAIIESSGLQKVQEEAGRAWDMMKEIEQELKEKAIARFEQAGDGNKKIHPAVSIIVQKKFVQKQGINTREADEWVMQNLPWARVIDWKSVDKYAKSVYGTPAAVPFYEKREVLGTRIQRDLSEYE